MDKRGADGIAVFERPYSTHAIAYYFDQRDTYVGRSYTGAAIPEFILSEQEKAYITGNLRSKGHKCQSFAEAVQYAVRETAQEATAQYKNRLAEILPQESNEALEAQKQFIRLLRESANYALLSRLEPESLNNAIFMRQSDFTAVSKYRDRQSINTLGICLSYTEKKVIQNLMALQRQAHEKFAQAELIGYSEDSKTNQAQGKIERGQDNGNSNKDNNRHGNNLSRGGRNILSGLSGGEDSAGGTLRQSQTEISGGISGFNLSEPADIGRIEQSLEGDRRTSRGNERASDGTNGESRRDYSRTENDRPDGMGPADEQSASQSGRDNLLQPHLRRRSGIAYKIISKPNNRQEKEATLKETAPAILEQVQDTVENLVGRIDGTENIVVPVENEWVQAAMEDWLKHHSQQSKWTAEMLQNLSSTLQDEIQQVHIELDQSKNISYGLTANGLKVWAGDEAAPTQESVFSWTLTAELLNHIIREKEKAQTPQAHEEEQNQQQAFTADTAENKLPDLTTQPPIQTQQSSQMEAQPQSRQLSLFDDFSGFAEDTTLSADKANRSERLNSNIVSTTADNIVSPALFRLNIPDEVWLDALYYGRNYADRFTLAQYFAHERAPQEAAEYLAHILCRKGKSFGRGLEYDNNTRFALWYDKDGITINYGSTVHAAAAEQRSWLRLAQDMQNYTANGAYLTVQDTQAYFPMLEHKLAERIAFISRELSEEAIESGYFAQLRTHYKNTFPDYMQHIQSILDKEQEHESLEREMTRFSAAYGQNPSLLRFPYDDVAEMKRLLTELYLAMPKSADAVHRPIQMFITDDEIHAQLLQGPNIEGAPQQVIHYLSVHEDNKACAQFLSNAYGIGGVMDGEKDFQTDGKGWHYIRRYNKTPYDSINLNWQQAVKRTKQAMALANLSLRQLSVEAVSQAHDSHSAKSAESKERFHNLLRQDSRSQAVIDAIEAQMVNAEAQEAGSIAQEAISATQEAVSKTIAAVNNHETAAITETFAVESAEDNILSAHLTDYRLPDKDFTGTPSQKFQANLAAIRTLKQIKAEQRTATDEEKIILAQYTGWGGLADYFDLTKNGYEELKALLTEEEYAAARSSTLTAFYTDNRYTDAIWQALTQMGFTGGNILEPACGTGHFLGRMPQSIHKNSCVYGVEKDSISGRIAQKLYPTMDISVIGYEQTDFADNVFDVAVSNVPFGKIQVRDERYDRLHFPIHDYYFAKTLDKVRPNGVIAFITSSFTMDKNASNVRRYIAERAELIGAVRLPDNAFASAGTEVMSDILFFQKRERPIVLIDYPEWIDTAENKDGLTVNQYFLNHPEQVIGELVPVSTAFGYRTGCKLRDGDDFQTLLDLAISNVSNIGKQMSFSLESQHTAELDQANRVDVRNTAAEQAGAVLALPTVDNYSYTIYGSQVYYRENAIMTPVEGSEAKLSHLVALINLRNTVKEMIRAQLNNCSDDDLSQMQAKLNQQYDEFYQKYGTINSKANKLLFKNDSSYYLLCSLENVDENGRLLSKADFFHKRTIKRTEKVSHVETAMDALTISIAEKACVDLNYMAQLLHGSEITNPQVLADLQTSIIAELNGVIYRNPAKVSSLSNQAQSIPNQMQNAADFDSASELSDLTPALSDSAPAPNADDIANSDDIATGWETSDQYLCGNVRQKLREAQAAAQKNPVYQVNVQALQAVQPPDIAPADIYAGLGAAWIPAKYIQEFAFELLETPFYLQQNIQITYSKVNASWHISAKSAANNVLSNEVYGTNRINAYHLLEQTLNLKDVKIYDKDYVDGKEVRILNAKDTMVAQSKQALIKEKFAQWIWQDSQRTADLVNLYNERFNANRLREYDGSGIAFDGINPEITLRPHQRNAIARVLYGGNTLLAHCVGAGKTFEIVAAAMESKRLGLCSKSLVVVPNHLTEQWGAEWLQLYPAAHILVATKQDFETANRKKFCARIATGDYDAVIIGHSQFERIPLSAERREKYIQEQIEELLEAISEVKAQGGQRFTVKQMEKSKANLEAQLEKLHDTKRKDDVITFEELGVDRLFVDEAHGFKNLFLRTKMTNVAGISQTEAQKSSDLFMKCQYMDELTGGRGITFATGTPLSNSMCELYTMQRYLQLALLKEKQLNHFDAWASTFGETVTTQELKPEGTGYRERTRFAKFHNLPEIMAMFREVADIQTAEMLKLPVPKVERHVESLEPSDIQREIVAALAERADAVRSGAVDSSQDNMLVITNDGRKLALDQRLINDALPDDENSKTNHCADNIYAIWQESTPNKGTQIVFCDLSTPSKVFNVYDDLKSKLILRGIPAEEIAYIHEAKSDAQKKELFSKVRSGQVRVIMGSTQKMGAGTNFQTRLIALHHLECPWRPADLLQREGRIIRQGNENETVHIYTYVTKDTFDAYLYQLIENKQRFISQIMQGGDTVRDAEDVDEAVLSYAEIKALATGNPLIRKKMELETELSRLKVLKANYVNQHYQLEIKVHQTYPEQIEKQTQAIQGYLEDIKLLQKHTPASIEISTADTGLSESNIKISTADAGFTEITIAGQSYTERKEAGEALMAQLTQTAFQHSAVPIGSYKGFALSVYYNRLGSSFYAELKGSMTYTVELGKDGSGNITRLDNKLKALPETLQKAQERLEGTKADLARAKEALAKSFDQEETLQQMQMRLEEINEELTIGMPIPDFSSIDEEEPAKAESGLTKNKSSLAMERA